MMLTLSAMATKAWVAEAPPTMSVEEFRYYALCDLGLSSDHAIALMEKPDIAHSAAKLIKNGCPPELVIELLRD